MAVIRMYTGNDDRTHFEEVPLSFERAGTGTVSGLLPVAGPPALRVTTEITPRFHTTQRPWYWVLLEGSVRVIGGNGDQRTLKPGDILLAEDTTGEGHMVRMDDCDQWTALYLPIAAWDRAAAEGVSS